MPIELDLQPVEIERAWDDRSAPEAITKDYRWICSAELAKLLTAPEFDPKTVPAAFLDAVDTATPTIIEDQLSYERTSIMEDYMPVHALIGSFSIGENVGLHFVPASAFLDNLKGQLRGIQPEVFEEFVSYRWAFEACGALDLFRDIHALTISQPEGWLDQAFQRVALAAESPNSPTLPRGADKALFLIPFLPGATRTLTREVIVNNVIMDRVRAKLGADLSPDSSVLLERVRQFYIADALTAQGWQDSIKHSPVTDATMTAIADYSIRKQELLAKIQLQANSGEGQDVVTALTTVAEELDQTVSQTMRASDASRWESIDIGHCFKGFANSRLFEACGLGAPWSKERFLVPEKSGSLTAILEDDDEQRTMWQQAVETITPSSTSDELCFAAPEGFIEQAANPQVRNFLIDIQNGQDETCGIRVAEAIFRERLEQARHNPNNPPQPTTIIIWSSSARLAEQAKARFKSLYKRSKDVAISLSGETQRGDAVITVDVRLKTWDYLRLK